MTTFTLINILELYVVKTNDWISNICTYIIQTENICFFVFIAIKLKISISESITTLILIIV